MKKNKIFLSALAILATVGSAYAVKTSNVFAATVYHQDAPGVYSLTTCDLTSIPSCDPAIVTQANTYFTRNANGTYSAIPVNTPLKRAQ